MKIFKFLNIQSNFTVFFVKYQISCITFFLVVSNFKKKKPSSFPKCDNVNVCFGALTVHRDVAAELEEDKILDINHTSMNA